MSAYLDKEKINTAITDSTHFDLSHVHITTANFMQLQPIYNKEMVPGEKIDVNVETFSRMNPLQVPTFGRANIKNRAYFVPFRTIFRGWNDFITDAPHVDSAHHEKDWAPSIANKVPVVTNNALAIAFVSSNWDMYGTYETGLVSGTSTDWDVRVKDVNGTSYKKFSAAGRVGIKVLESLGYEVNWNVYDKTEFSALPLLALAKVYTDWYFPNAYTNNSNYARLLALCNYDNNDSPLVLTYQDVAAILNMVISVSYDSDYFVSAWDSPTCPGVGKVSDYRMPNLDYIGTVYGSNLYAVDPDGQNGVSFNQGVATNDTALNRYGNMSSPFITGYVTGKATPQSNSTAVTGGISQYMLHSLHALTDYLKRHQLVGSKAMDRYLARYGKALPAEKMNRSIYLGSQVVPIQIGDVMSQADTEGAALGQYAGKGMAYGSNGNFSYKTDEFGMFIIVSSIVPATGYFQGRNRLNTKHITRLDFWTPEMESIGTQPITSDELYMTQDGASPLADNYLVDGSFGPAKASEKIFGYTPRYAEYKVPFDQVTGNMRLRSLNGDVSTNNGIAAWHLMRVMDDADFVDASNNVSLDEVVHSLDFCYSRGDMGEYNRIFAYTDGRAPDQFTIIHQFNIGDYAPMKPLYDSYDWLDKGKKVTLDVNGVKHN